MYQLSLFPKTPQTYCENMDAAGKVYLISDVWAKHW